MNPIKTPLNFELIPDGTNEYWIYSQSSFHSFTCVHNPEHKDDVQSCTITSSFHISDLNAIQKHDGTDVGFYVMRCDGNPIRVSWKDRDLSEGKRYWDDAYIFATRNEAILFAKRLNRINRNEIIYAPEWIPKILSGQKTMTIRRTQYPCGVYDVVSEAEPNRVVCRIEVVKVEKVEFELFIQPHKSRSIKVNTSEIKTEVKTWDDFNRITDLIVSMSGFESGKDFIQYHRDNYAPVKFAHTFELVKGDSL